MPHQGLPPVTESELFAKELSRRRFLAGLGGVAAGGILAACTSGTGPSTRSPGAPTQAGTPKRGGVLIVGTSEEPFANAFDMVRGGLSVLTSRVAYLAFNGLVDVDGDRNVIPDLAESWEIPDPQTYIFNLKQGVKFHDGTDFDAEAVRFNILRVLDPEIQSDRAPDFEAVESVDVLSAHQVRVNLSRPFAPMLGKFRRSFLNILSPTAVEQYDPEDSFRASVGTGPFKFVSLRRGDRVVLERFDEYSKDGLPYLDGIEVRIIPEQSTQLAAMQSGDIHYMMQTNPEFGPQIENHPDLQLLSHPSPIWDYLIFNVTREPFDDVGVRRAFSMAVERDGILNGIYQGLGTVAQGAIGPVFQDYYRDNSDVAYQSYDPDAARSLLSDRQFDFDRVLRYDTFSERPWGLVGDAVAAALTEIGVQLDIVKPDFNTFAEYFFGTKDYWIANNTWTIGGVDPDDMIYKQFLTGHGFNLGLYSNPQVDRLLEQAREELDTARRADIYNEANRIVMDECPVGFLVHPHLVEGMRKEVQGYVFRDEFAGSYDECWLEQ